MHSNFFCQSSPFWCINETTYLKKTLKTGLKPKCKVKFIILLKDGADFINFTAKLRKYIRIFRPIFMNETTLESAINVAPCINVGHGKLGKKISLALFIYTYFTLVLLK